MCKVGPETLHVLVVARLSGAERVVGQLGWGAARQLCLEVGAAADSVWLLVAGARQWELLLPASATDDHTHHAYHIGHGSLIVTNTRTPSPSFLRLLKFCLPGVNSRFPFWLFNAGW